MEKWVKYITLIIISSCFLTFYEYLNDYFDTKLEYCLYDGVAKGFKVYDHVKDEGILKDYITYSNDDYKSDYYLFFQFKSINIGEMNSVSKTNNALKVIKELMELWKNIVTLKKAFIQKNQWSYLPHI